MQLTCASKTSRRYDCADPSKLSFRGKAREYLINATQLPSPGLRLEKMALWGGTVAVVRSELTLDTVNVLFPTANRRVLDEVWHQGPTDREFRGLT